METPKLVAGPFNHMRQCRYGYMLYNCNDMYLGRSLDLYGEFSEGEMELLRQLIRPGDICIDAGSNIGTHTIFLARTVGPQGRVYAFEPQRLVFQTLCANMALNSMANAYCINAAAGTERGYINVPALDFTRTNNFGGLSLDVNMPGETVDMITIDSLNLPALRLLKADVEGMELHVLKGATETIKRHFPVMYIENDRVQNSLALTQFIDSLGYEMYWHMPPLFNPRNFFGNGINVFSNIVSVNLLCVHPSWNITLQGFTRTHPGEKHPMER
jgi:FkbM family methyltransferase